MHNTQIISIQAYNILKYTEVCNCWNHYGVGGIEAAAVALAAAATGGGHQVVVVVLVVVVVIMMRMMLVYNAYVT